MSSLSSNLLNPNPISNNNGPKSKVNKIDSNNDSNTDSNNIDRDNKKETIINTTEDQFHECITKDKDLAITHKELGNKFYASADYENAIKNYTLAINYCPDNDNDKSIFYSNRAAKQWNLAIKDSAESLKINPDNIKSLTRRAKAFEETDKLYEAQQDWKTVLEKDPSNDIAKKNYARLDPIVKARTEKQKEEVMGKLKDLGNSLLGKFGMSLDNFKTQQDPNTGQYNISFGK